MAKEEYPENQPVTVPTDPVVSAMDDRSDTLDEQYIRKAVASAVQDTVKDEPYSHEATSDWTNAIVESLVKTLVQVDRDNKYIGSFSITLQNLLTHPVVTIF